MGFLAGLSMVHEVFREGVSREFMKFMQVVQGLNT